MLVGNGVYIMLVKGLGEGCMRDWVCDKVCDKVWDKVCDCVRDRTCDCVRDRTGDCVRDRTCDCVCDRTCDWVCDVPDSYSAFSSGLSKYSPPLSVS